MNKIIVITGPTGVGKTKASIELAKRYNGEIINADSMQVYKNLDIGTAKIIEEEKENITHHLFDIKEVTDEYSIYDYQKDCRKVIEDIKSREKTPILVGGTGLYIKSALYDYRLNYSNKFNTYDELNNEELYNKLISMDKVIEGKIDKFNRRRLINAVNYYEKNKTSIINNKTNELLYDTIFIGLTTERGNLYSIINNRVDQMINNGLIDEVNNFYKQNLRTKPLLGGIGYKELYEYFDGKISLSEAIELIKKNSRKYAKRQYTFFNHQMPVVWFNIDYDNFNNTIDQICNYIDKEGE